MKLRNLRRKKQRRFKYEGKTRKLQKKWFAAIMVDLRFKPSGGTWLRTRMPIIEIGF